MKKFLVLLLIVLAGFSAYAAGYNPSDVNGSIGAGEYSGSEKLQKADLHWQIDGDKLRIALKADTNGWIAVGLGSSRMDGSIMFIGYSKDGKSFLEEHKGQGHRHSKVDSGRVLDYSVSESAEGTVMEIAVDKSDFLSSGQKSLPVIIAYGARDNFSSMHRYRDKTEIDF